MLKNKIEKLKKHLETMNEQGICLAFSGGIDSLILLYLCKNSNITAITFKTDFQTESEISEAQKICAAWGIKQAVVYINTFENPILQNNPKDRCYHCKKLLFAELKKYAGQNNLKYLIDGTNYDDLSAYRPGLRALQETGISSPLAEFEITKSEIREFAKKEGIIQYNKPSTPCLATRFPYGTKLSAENIKIVEQGENILKSFGFENNRLRMHKDIARIEIPKEQFETFFKNEAKITKQLKQTGLRYITLDLEGLRSGSMD